MEEKQYKVVCDAWEYHPVYGSYSRLVYRQMNDGLHIIGREYGRPKPYTED